MAKNEGSSDGVLEDDVGRRGRQVFKQDAGQSIHSSSHGKVGIVQLSRMARGLPQAVLKVTSFSSGHQKVRARLTYISREGELELEDQDGNIIEDKQEVLDEWSVDFRGREGQDLKRQPRDTMNLVLSTPAGSEVNASHEAARQFLREAFAENHSYVFAGHDDTDHYHVHAIVKYKGHDGKLLRANKQDLRQWRDQYAKQCREQGIQVEASHRWQRGKHFKKAIPATIYETEKRGTQYHQDRWRTEKSTNVLQQLQAREKRLRVRNQALQKEYFSIANKLVGAVEKLPKPQQAKILVESAAMVKFATELPKTETSIKKEDKAYLVQLATLANQSEKLKRLNIDDFKRHAKKVIEQVTASAQIER